MTEPIPKRQFDAWLLVASVGTILSVAGYNGWLGVLPAAALCPLLCCAVRKCRVFPKWLRVAELIWLPIYLGGVAKLSGTCWEASGQFTAIPIILLALAALASRRGSLAASRVGAALLFLVIPVLAVVLVAGLGDARTDWIKTEMQMPGGVLISLLLLPCLATHFQGTTEKRCSWIPWASGLLAVAASLVLGATMGGTAGSGLNNGFYEYSKGINLFGVAERFEPLVACALTLSWFVLFCVIFSAVYHLTKEFCEKVSGWSVWLFGTAAVAFLYILPNGEDWLGVGSLIFWVFLPMIAQGLAVRKKDVKK